MLLWTSYSCVAGRRQAHLHLPDSTMYTDEEKTARKPLVTPLAGCVHCPRRQAAGAAAQCSSGNCSGSAGRPLPATIEEATAWLLQQAAKGVVVDAGCTKAAAVSECAQARSVAAGVAAGPAHVDATRNEVHQATES